MGNGNMLQGEELVERIRKAARALGWRVPMFWPAIQQTSVQVCDLGRNGQAGTACIDAKGVMRFDPTFCAELTDAELSAVVAHELCHLIYRHLERREDRQARRFNIACDMALNQILREAQEQLPSSAIYPTKGQELWTAEAIYDQLPEQPEGEGMGPQPALAGCGPDGPEGPGGDADGDDGEGEGGEVPSQADVRKWREVAAQCKMTNRGDAPGRAYSKLFEVPAQKVRWEEILRHAMMQAIQAHGRDDQSWQRRGRRSGAEGAQFPGYTSYKASAAVVIDSSGSVDDESLAVAALRVREIAVATGVRTLLVVHDAAVQWAGWVTAATPVDTLRATTGMGRGGTVFTGAYERVGAERAKFDAIVHLTDGEGVWPTPAIPRNCRRLVVALIGSRNRGYLPKDVPNLRVIDAMAPKGAAK